MEVLFRAAAFVLMLLSSSGAFAADDCNLPPEVQRQDLHKLSLVPWVLVEGFEEDLITSMPFAKANSSIVEFKVKDNNQTFLYSEKSMEFGKCLFYRVNASISDPETSNYTLHMHRDGMVEFQGVFSPSYDEAKLNFYQPCPSCLIIMYSANFLGTPGRNLRIYRSKGKHLDADELKAAESEHKRIAECLKFNVPAFFRYDGKTEFC